MEYVQFIGALILFVGILVGSYWFVYTPNRRRRSDEEGRKQTEG